MGKKTLWKKKKLLVASNFSFSHSVFKRLVLQTRKNQDLFGKELRRLLLSELNPLPYTPFWDRPKFKDAADDNWNVAIEGF